MQSECKEPWLTKLSKTSEVWGHMWQWFCSSTAVVSAQYNITMCSHCHKMLYSKVHIPARHWTAAGVQTSWFQESVGTYHTAAPWRGSARCSGTAAASWTASSSPRHLLEEDLSQQMHEYNVTSPPIYRNWLCAWIKHNQLHL